jgi:hypothetical protein
MSLCQHPEVLTGLNVVAAKERLKKTASPPLVVAGLGAAMTMKAGPHHDFFTRSKAGTQ